MLEIFASSRPLLPTKCQESCFLGWFIKMQQTQISLGLCNGIFCPPTNACQMCKLNHICKHQATCSEWACRAKTERMQLMPYCPLTDATWSKKLDYTGAGVLPGWDGRIQCGNGLKLWPPDSVQHIPWTSAPIHFEAQHSLCNPKDVEWVL